MQNSKLLYRKWRLFRGKFIFISQFLPLKSKKAVSFLLSLPDKLCVL